MTQATRRHDAIIARGGPRPDLARGLQRVAAGDPLRPATPNTDAAEQCLAVARRLAVLLGADRNYYDTEFGPTNVAIHAVGVAVELGNGRQALDRAVHVRHAEQLSAERQARYLIDIARAHLLTRSGRDALLALVKAEHIAPEELAKSPRVAELIDDIESLNKRTRLPGLKELRQRLYG